MAFFEHEDLIGGEGRVGQNSFGYGGEEATEWERDGKKNRFSPSQPKPGKSGENHIWGVIDPSRGKAHGSSDVEGEVAKIGLGSTKIKSLADGAGLSEGTDESVGHIGYGDGPENDVGSAW